MLLDTSAWIEFFKGSEGGKKVITYMQKHDVFTSVISLVEISDWCYKNNKEPKKLFKVIENNSTVIELDEEILILVGRVYNEQRNVKSKFGMIDALIATTAVINNMSVLTFDYDFEGLSKSIILD